MALRLPAIVLLSAVLASAALAGCSGQGDEVSLSWLVERQSAFDGEYLSTRGVVRGFDDPEHYWIEDAALNRVALEPHHKVEGLVGRHVRVSGHFSYRRDAGRRIVLDEVQVLDE